jgi:hypothetical protein
MLITLIHCFLGGPERPVAVIEVQRRTPKALRTASQAAENMGCTDVHVLETYSYIWSYKWGLDMHRG